MRRPSWCGIRRSEGRWSVTPREREGDDGQPEQRLRGAERERRRWGYGEVAVEDRSRQGRSRAGVAPPDTGTGPVGAGVGARVVLVGGGGIRGSGPRLRPVVMRAVVRAERIPDPPENEQKGEYARKRSLRAPRHAVQFTPAHPGKKAPGNRQEGTPGALRGVVRSLTVCVVARPYNHVGLLDVRHLGEQPI